MALEKWVHVHSCCEVRAGRGATSCLGHWACRMGHQAGPRRPGWGCALSMLPSASPWQPASPQEAVQMTFSCPSLESSREDSQEGARATAGVRQEPFILEQAADALGGRMAGRQGRQVCLGEAASPTRGAATQPRRTRAPRVPRDQASCPGGERHPKKQDCGGLCTEGRLTDRGCLAGPRSTPWADHR